MVCLLRMSEQLTDSTRKMTYEDIWQKIKSMSQRERKQLAYEMTLKGFNASYIHPHYYFDAKAVHDILFYPPNSQKELSFSPDLPCREREKRAKRSMLMH